MYSIGDFSRISGLTVKALRHYHEKGILTPRTVDQETGYRYYDTRNLERARGIVYLKQMMFPLEDMAEILRNFEDDSDILEFLASRRGEIKKKISEMQKVVISIDEIVRREQEAKEMVKNSDFEVEQRDIDTILVASIRWKGSYDQCGERFATLYKKMGRVSCGKPMNLYYDEGYKESDADIETCLPIRKGKDVDGITVKELEGGKALTLIHKGPYDQIGRSYEKISNYAGAQGMKLKAPGREIYVKGPGMIFKGNPKNYLTEIQFLLES